MKNLIKGMLLVLVFLSACARNDNTAAEEAKVLSQSAFYSGEQAAGLREVNLIGGESGTISPPGNTSSSPETGNIPAPGSSTGSTGGSTSPTSPSGAVSGPTPTGGSTTGSTAPTTPSTGTTSPTQTPVPSPTGSTTVNNPVTPIPSTGGNDGGTIGGTTPVNGGDSGGIIPGTSTGGTTTPGTSTGSTGTTGGGTSVGSSENPGGSSTTSPGTTPGGTSNPGDNGGSTTVNNPPTTTTPNGNGNDGGVVNNNPSSPGGSTGGTTAGNNPNPSPSPTIPSTGGNPSSGNNNPPVVAGNGGVNTPPNPNPPTWIDIIKNWFDGGSISNNNPRKTPDIGKVNKNITASIARVCSYYRSQIKYPEFIFFEEARNPILSMEATLPAEYRACELQQASYKYGSYQGYSPFMQYYDTRSTSSMRDGNVVLKAIDLKNIDMFEARWHDTINFEIEQLKAQFPTKWYQIAKEIIVTVHVCDDANKNGRCTDEKPARILSINTPVFTLDHIPSSMALEVWHGRHFTLAADPEICEKQYSPLVLDLTGQGFELSGPGDGVYFDLNNTGKEVATGWTKGKNLAFLVRDVNKSGAIENGSELFGNATKLQSGSLALNGFEALKDLDSNGDGKFDKNDQAWKQVKLWIDANHNGKSERSEFFSLEYFQVESINLNYVGVTEVDPYGNQTRQRSTYIRRVNGKAIPLQIIDAWFNTLVSN